MPSGCRRSPGRTRLCFPRWSRNWPRDATDIVVFGGGVIPEADFGLSSTPAWPPSSPRDSLDLITSWAESNVPAKI